MMVSPTGAPVSHAMMNSTLRDMGRYGMLFTPSWKKISKSRVVPESLIKKIQTSGRPDVIRAGIGFDYFNEYAHGDINFATHQFDYTTTDGDFAKAGFHGQTIYISPNKDLVVASFATGEKYETFKFARAIANSIK